ncbi:hypothetical protein SFRURICE_007670 [Spodoptera frugiperda]|nr:hypothetical protein SFRURICE_007670 [Spodoptera frugiperda]
MANAAGGSETWLQWLVQTNDAKQLWEAQPTYILSQAVYILAGIVTLIHAFSKGGRWPYFWLGTILHGLFTDNFWHFALPEYDNFWHSQTPIIFLGARLPLHIILLYPAFIYHAAYAISRLNLPKYSEPFAVGLVTVLVDIPYDIVAVKFVHWTWHDTDPNIYDRHYWVPWNSYYFHATFAASFFYFFHVSRSWFAPKVTQWDAADKKAEWKSLLISSLLGMPGGVLMFIPIYHPLHDVFNIHSEVTFFLLFSIFAVLEKRKYFCPKDYNEDYFDFHCAKELPRNGATWYLICGTPFENRAEYITVLSTILVVAAGVFYGLYFKTGGGTPEVTPKKLKKK